VLAYYVLAHAESVQDIPHRTFPTCTPHFIMTSQSVVV
jgi:hypothetical protein